VWIIDGAISIVARSTAGVSAWSEQSQYPIFLSLISMASELPQVTRRWGPGCLSIKRRSLYSWFSGGYSVGSGWRTINLSSRLSSLRAGG